MFDEFLEAFSLGNAAILGNVCMLPLYPGLFVLLANQGREARASRVLRWMGLLVLAGVVSAMMAIGLLLYLVQRSTADVLDWLLPVMYGAVLILGLAMVFGRNPFVSLSTAKMPILRRPAATSFLYGMLLAPLTLPCTGPVIISAFVIGSVSGTRSLLDSLAYFLWFSLGFGWPLVLLPLLAAPIQRSVIRTLTRHHRQVEFASGVLLIAIAAIGYWNDLRPMYAAVAH
jgi:cytochrome c-type biogenesis protein